MRPDVSMCGSGKGTLRCQVFEENHQKKESYRAEWDDTTVSRVAESATNLREANTARKESLERRGQMTLLVQRSPAGLMRLGGIGWWGAVPFREHRVLPASRPVLPVPIFTPAKIGLPKASEREPTPLPIKGMLEFESALGARNQAATGSPTPRITDPKIDLKSPGIYPALARSNSQLRS